jgi:hypothetical protein
LQQHLLRQPQAAGLGVARRPFRPIRWKHAEENEAWPHRERIENDPVADGTAIRRVLLTGATGFVGRNLYPVLRLCSYALAQLGTGSCIVMLLAGVCGSIWTLQRRLTLSLLPPLLAHLIWTPIVIWLHPVYPG